MSEDEALFSMPLNERHGAGAFWAVAREGDDLAEAVLGVSNDHSVVKDVGGDGG